MKEANDRRRSFLKHIFAGTVAVAASTAAIKPAKAKSVSKLQGEKETLYSESESFKKYYKTLR